MQVDGLIRNFYEKLVLDEINHQAGMISLEEDQWADVACVALNQLPSRYFRHSVDMAFYLSSEEYTEMLSKIKLAVQAAIKTVRSSAIGE